MKQQQLLSLALVCLLAVGAAACSEPAAPATPLAPQARANAAQPSTNTPTPEPTSAPEFEIARGVTGIGEVMAAREADLFFAASGTVAEVLVQEGAMVEQGQALAALDLRPFDQQVRQAEAALAGVLAQQSGLDEQPRAAEFAAARAQLESSQATLRRLNQGAREQDVQITRASLEAAQAQLQSTRNQLSYNKTQADAQVRNAAESLTQAQAAYAQAKSNWDFVQETGNNPQNPSSINPLTGAQVENKVTDAQREAYYAAFVQAEAALRKAELGVEQALIAAEEARKAEIVGIQAAEQQVVQAEETLSKVQLPPEADQVAAAQAQIAGAQARLDALNAPTRDSTRAQVAASVAQAQAGVELARLTREFAELRAPFDGVIAAINIDPGDPSATGARPAIRIVDLSSVHIDVDINAADIAHVQVGQTAEAYIDGWSGRAFGGTVSYIAPTATTMGSLRTFLVRIELDDADGLRPGMTARVTIRTDQ